MKVKIIKSKSPDLWYADKIGEIFKVRDYIDNEGMYRITQSSIYAPSYIYAEDADILMNLQEQKIDAFNKIKQVVVKHNLDISDQEISECIQDLSEVKTLSVILAKCSAEENLQIINKQMSSNFTLNTPLYDILDEISKKWNSL